MNLYLLKINELNSAFWQSSTASFNKILGVMDELLLAVAIILLGWVVSNWVKNIIWKIGERVRVANVSAKIGLTKLLLRANIKTPPSRLIGEFIKGYILTIFIIAAANVLGFHQISQFLDDVIGYIPNVLIALVIMLFGLKVAETTGAILENTLKMAHSQAARILGLTAKYIILTFSVMATLFQLKIAADLVQILFTGFIAMIALAGGLAFGLGGKEVVQEFLEDLKEKPKVKDNTKINISILEPRGKKVISR